MSDPKDFSHQQGWQDLLAIDWWQQAVQLMHDTGKPLDCLFRFSNHSVQVQVSIVGIDDQVTGVARRH